MAKKKITGKPASKKVTTSILKWFESNPEPRLICVQMFNSKDTIKILERKGNEMFCNLENEHFLVNLDKKSVTTFGNIFTSGINSKNDVPWTVKDECNELPRSEDIQTSERHSKTSKAKTIKSNINKSKKSSLLSSTGRRPATKRLQATDESKAKGDLVNGNSKESKGKRIHKTEDSKNSSKQTPKRNTRKQSA